jgi:GNAT superfamily N-acetyltransferase
MATEQPPKQRDARERANDRGASAEHAERHAAFDPHRCRLTIRNDPTVAPVVQGFVSSFATAQGFQPREVDGLERFIVGVARWAVLNSYGPGERGDLDVTCERIPGGMRIVFHDTGLPLDTVLLPTRSAGAVAAGQPENDFDRALSGGLVDAVELRDLGRHGKQAVFTKYLRAGLVADVTLDEDDEGATAGNPSATMATGPPSAPGVAAGPSAELQFGLMRPEQAAGVCRCIYDAYGREYIRDTLYYPERIVALNRSGDMISAVATAPDGAVAGHFALVFPEEEEGVGEMAAAVTDRSWRGHGIADRLGETLLAEAQRRGLYGVFMEALTAHGYSQLVAQRLGMAPCAFRLAQTPASLGIRGIDEHRSTRHSFLLCYSQLAPRPTAPLHVPPHHREVVAALFGNFGEHVTFAAETSAPTDSPPEGGETRLHTTIEPVLERASITTKSYQGNVADAFHAEVHRLKGCGVKVIDVYLDMRMSGTDGIARLLEERGFLFTGIIPGGPSTDWMIFEYFHGVLVEYDKIVVASERAQRLPDYICARDTDAM